MHESMYRLFPLTEAVLFLLNTAYQTDKANLDKYLTGSTRRSALADLDATFAVDTAYFTSKLEAHDGPAV